MGPYAGDDYITSPYFHSKDDSNTFTMGSPMLESTLTLCQSRLYSPGWDFGYGLSPESNQSMHLVKGWGGGGALCRSVP